MKVHFLDYWRRGAGKGHQIVNQVAHPGDLTVDYRQEGGAEFRVVQTLRKKLGKGVDRNERITDFVSKACSKSADRGQPVCACEQLLRAFEIFVEPSVLQGNCCFIGQ